MDSFWIWTVALSGAAVGFAGAALGVWKGLGSAKADAERRRIVWWSVGILALVVAHSAVQILAPLTWRWIGWGVYGPALAFCVLTCNRDLGRFHAAGRQSDGGRTSQSPPSAS